MPIVITLAVLAVVLVVNVLLGLLFHPVNTLRWIVLQLFGWGAVICIVVAIGTWLNTGLVSALGWVAGGVLLSFLRHRIDLAW
ncbi:hypothetical protein DWB68_13300 [Galactobacter valiniphilus]|uniref:DUF4175 domain-containing protein n=1 Tax=Galactobacter valiniphilus TaxID=2676122 RepID=A0A399JBB2_9MICC|nr:hypothetical protein [Galactobacter valiniphilus]RII41312.1 hypothetical protein DWB68_13300 [Galactobacter valiniphilus]